MPYLDKEAKKKADRERLRVKRGATNGATNGRGDTGGDNYPDGTRALLFPPSKFLSIEEDRKVQENVVNTLKMMSGSRLQQFRGLGNTFTPSIKKDPTLKIPFI